MQFLNQKAERADPIRSDPEPGIGLIADFYPVDICHVYPVRY